MKIVVLYNRSSKNVINLFGQPNKEKYGLKSIKRILDALKAGGHNAVAFEADKDLIDHLEQFMPRVLKSERPGMVFNLSYGIQGQARYTHVPGILEMMGIPYVGSGPLAHSLALDKEVAKMIFKQRGVPTPEFAMIPDVDAPLPQLPFPLIVKPKNESVSFGIKVVNSQQELREAADVIVKEFQQPVLVEQYIDGREINVGIIGNNPPEALPPAELAFGAGGPKIYTEADKKHQSGRTVDVVCPAKLTPAQTERAQQVAIDAFKALGLFDCARVDMRLDDKGNFYVLEINSLPSMGEHGSYVQGAEAAGLDFVGLVNRLVEVASARYFGTPTPPALGPAAPQKREERTFAYITQRRDRIERRLREWVAIDSRTDDPVGLQAAAREWGETVEDLGLRRHTGLTDERSVWTYETGAGLAGGTLLVAHLDVPTGAAAAGQRFRREPEWLYGDGIGSSRAPLTAIEFALRAARHQKILRRTKLGVLVYADEGRDARYSGALIAKAAAAAGEVIVLRPGNIGNRVVVRRRGERRYRLTVEGGSRRIGAAGKKPEVFRWASGVLDDYAKQTDVQQRLAVSTVDVKLAAFPLRVPHRVDATLIMTYPSAAAADACEQVLKARLAKAPFKAKLTLLAERPPMAERRSHKKLYRALAARAAEWDVPFGAEDSAWPSVAGLAPAATPAICGMGPAARDLYTPQEAVQRISLIQRTLLLAQVIADRAPARKSGGKTVR